ncbi:hypothetical protein BOTBODRAFT_181711 [Botryobasidium botryosum FD-172 SS1]|uniref:Endonuclease/exonuclease/phosphatase domain-containing protein n=1 Tax=Botryobasidium botryosum (strain FD-172 SS1) TaxID=930990 RepID=A0A067M3A3_BOTB1|nr:hypothetical protein BOTBODRAFT_181711 [Botryobasidium botryosum FD-172 SS1]
MPPKPKPPFTLIPEVDTDPPSLTELDRVTALSSQRGWIQAGIDSMSSFPALAGQLNEDAIGPKRAVLTRLFLEAISAITVNDAELLRIMESFPMWKDGPLALLKPADDSSTDSDSNDNATPDKGKQKANNTPARLTAIEDAIVRIEALAREALKPRGPPPTTTAPLPPRGQSSGRKNQGRSPAMGANSTPIRAPKAQTTSQTTTTTPAVTVTTQITPKDTYANKAKNAPKFNPSPKMPSAFRKKARGPMPFGEVLFAPDHPFTRDGNENQPDGSNSITLINRSLEKAVPLCSIKGLKWTPRGNLLLTPSSPDQWDILAKHGPGALETASGMKFSLISQGPTTNLVLHGWSAKSTALPNVGTVCASITTSLGLDPLDILIDKCHWLIGKNPNPDRSPLLLVAITMDEAAEKLLFNNPHWIEGQKVSFKAFHQDATVPNQCVRCWEVSHPTWRCSAKTPVCGLCSDGHPTIQHRCGDSNCNVIGKSCTHSSLQCPNCQGNHTAWDRASSRLGHPGCDISNYRDTELVKKFRLWTVYNGLPTIQLNTEGVASWDPDQKAPIVSAFLPLIGPSSNGQHLTVLLDRASDTHHVLVVSELPWNRIGAGRKGAPKHHNWVTALPLSPMPNDGTPRIGIYVNKKLLPNHGLTINPNTFNRLDTIHTTITAHGWCLNIFGFYRTPKEYSSTDPAQLLQAICEWEVPLADSIIMGNFNLHHSSWDVRSKDTTLGKHFRSWAMDEGLHLLNDPAIPTLYPTDTTKKPTVINLTLVNGGLKFNWTTAWEVDGVIGQPADHLGTRLTLHPRFREHNTQKPPRTHKKGAIDWTLFQKTLKEALAPYADFLHDADPKASTHLLTTAIEISLSQAEGPTSNRSNPLPFWDSELTLFCNDKERLAREYCRLPRFHPG